MFGGVGVWMVHLVFVVAAEHWTAPASAVRLDPARGDRRLCAGDRSSRCFSRGRLFVIASGSDPESDDDAGQLLFLAQLGLLVGAINLALILLEGSYALFIPRG